jgi:hypothetical protein
MGGLPQKNDVGKRDERGAVLQYDGAVSALEVNGLVLAFEARSPWAISEGCPGLRSDRDRQRSTTGW